MAFKNILLLSAVLLNNNLPVSAESEPITSELSVAPRKGPIDWEKHPYDEQEYFKDIPDLIDMKKT